MATTTVRVSEETRRALKKLADQTREPMQQVLAKAVEMYRRHKFLEEANAAYAELRADPETWREEEEERTLWNNKKTVVDRI